MPDELLEGGKQRLKNDAVPSIFPWHDTNERRSLTSQQYKYTNTIKVLIGVTPSGAISFVSEAYEGSISDHKLVEVSGLWEKLQPGDEIMADKGFTIQDLLIPYGVRLNMPPLPFSQQSDGSK